MELVTVTQYNRAIYLNLAQCYEAEFSALTHKKPDAQGRFALDTQLSETVMGVLLMVEGLPAALAAVAHHEGGCYEVCEFYVVPSFRRHALGRSFAHMLWDRYPGRWEIKQIEGAQYATAFWRKCIRAYHQTPYEEDHYEDRYWGLVTRQRFTIAQSAG